MSFKNYLNQNLESFKPLFDPVLTIDNTVYMDLSSSNREFNGLGENELDQAILQKLSAAGAIAGVGGYLENRSVYKNTELFQGDEERCIHVVSMCSCPREPRCMHHSTVRCRVSPIVRCQVIMVR